MTSTTITTAEVLGVVRGYLFGSQAERMTSASILADQFRDSGDDAAADALCAAPSLNATTHLLTLAKPLAVLETARLAGKMLDEVLSREKGWEKDAAGAMLYAMSRDRREDFAEEVRVVAELMRREEVGYRTEELCEGK